MKIGATDEFESRYMAKFQELANPHGIIVEYKRDRAARDIGLHLTQRLGAKQGTIVTPALIWFQMKGLMKETVDLDKFEKFDQVSISLETAHLRFWYLNIQPTYLAVYIEAADLFLAIDIKDWVNRNFGKEILTDPRKSITVKVHKKNVLDDHFFRLVLNRNLIPALRNSLSKEKDEEIARFLRDSTLVKWLAICSKEKAETRMRVISWISKMRTEVYFESRNAKGEWEKVRIHWQFMMGEIKKAFPFLSMKPKRKVIEYEEVEYDEDIDGVTREIVTKKLDFVENEDDEYGWDDQNIDYDCLLSLGGNEYSYGAEAGGEFAEHEIIISLNRVGRRWANTLKILEDAEVISVDVKPHFIDVAPWHARDV